MEQWALFTADTGDEITRGYQATYERACKFAQDTADRLGRAVELESEHTLIERTDDDHEAPVGEVFEPSKEG